MINETAGIQPSRRWDSVLFLSAGLLMLVNVALLWVRYYSTFQLSILWTAVPGILGLTASIIGLLTLRLRLSSNMTPWLARAGAGFALLAAVALCIAAIWIFSMVLFLGGLSEPTPDAVQTLIGIFVGSMVMAFALNAAAFLVNGSSQTIGYLLMVPVASWGFMLFVGITSGLQSGLSLDLYANGLIAAAFWGIGFRLKKS